MAIPDEDVAQVRAATDILALIGEHTGLKRVGRRYVGLCPFHSERTGSFSVNAEEGLYYCFGCQAGGDAIDFVRAIEHCDFVEAVERLAVRAGITIRVDESEQANAARGRRQELYELLARAADFYHERLLAHADAGRARQYLRSRGYDGEVVRDFQLGYAPASYDELVRHLKAPRALLLESGLAYESRNGPIDVFRDRVVFPILEPGGKAIALGGRVLPEELRRSSREPGPKYRNSAESSIYAKRRTLYGLNWAKAEIVRTDEAIVCEGYTDVIGLFRAGLPRAVATCGTALTEDHFRLLHRFTKRIVLAFDADAAGQNAAARLYDWERRHELELAVAALPPGADPADLATSDPEALRKAIEGARPFLAFRIDRALATADLSSPEGRSRAANTAIDAIAEHPDDLVRDGYLRTVADRTGHEADRLRPRLEERREAFLRRATEPDRTAPTARLADPPPPPSEPGAAEAEQPRRRRTGAASRAGRDALLLAIHRPDTVGDAFDECLFDDAIQRRAYRALAKATTLHSAIEASDEEVAECIRRLSVEEIPDDVDVEGTLVALVAAAGTRALAGIDAQVRLAEDAETFARWSEESRWLREELELVRRDPVLHPGLPSAAVDAARRLVAWLRDHPTER